MTRAKIPALRNVTIVSARRLNNSRNGNPRFTLAFSDGTIADTMSDASISYDVENVQRSGAHVDVYLTRAGRVSWWQRVETIVEPIVSTWCDAFGLWHASVKVTRGRINDAQARRLARAAVAQELAARAPRGTVPVFSLALNHRDGQGDVLTYFYDERTPS